MYLTLFEPGVFPARAWRLGDGKIALVLWRPGSGRPAKYAHADTDTAAALRAALLAGDHLWTLGGRPALVWGHHTVVPPTRQAGIAEIADHVFLATHTGAQPPGDLLVPNHELERHKRGPDRTWWADVCRASGWHPLAFEDRSCGLFNMLATSDVPEIHVTVDHPVYVPPGTTLPRGTLAPPPPRALTIDDGVVPFPHLRRLFSDYPLAPAAHARLYSWLLYHFHARSLAGARPLLVLESWDNSRGKSRMALALSALVDGAASAVEAPRNDSNDRLVAQFRDGRRVLIIDNLRRQRPYHNPWLSTLVSTGAAADRAKYAASTTTFRGRSAVLTMVYGHAPLDVDFRSRAWRVEIPGRGPLLFSEVSGDPDRLAPDDYALAHREALHRELYWAVATAPPWTQGTSDRNVEAVEGLAAYAHVFGKPGVHRDTNQARIAETLAAAAGDAEAYDEDFMRAVLAAGGPGVCVESPLQPRPLRDDATHFENLSACGLTARRRGNRMVLENTEEV